MFVLFNVTLSIDLSLKYTELILIDSCLERRSIVIFAFVGAGQPSSTHILMAVVRLSWHRLTALAFRIALASLP
jgi:hypothetical protein